MERQREPLHRYPEDAMAAGVCAGLARHLDIDVAIIRAAFVGLAVLSGFGIAAYLALWWLVEPVQPEPAPPASATAGPDSGAESAADLPVDPVSGAAIDDVDTPSPTNSVVDAELVEETRS